MREEHGVSADHVHARGHHRRRVDQRRDRRRTLHRVRQPDVERNLRALAGRADEQQQADRRQHAEMRRLDRHRRRGILDGAEIERAEHRVDQKDAEDESPVADAVRDERLLAGVSRTLLLVPVADQQVRAETDAFPAHEHHQEVVSQDEHEHEEAEQIEIAEEAGDASARLVGHVRRRVDVNQRADAGDDQQHHPGQRIEPESPGHLEACRSPRRASATGSPGSTRRWSRRRRARRRADRATGQNATIASAKRSHHRGARQRTGGLARERSGYRRGR